MITYVTDNILTSAAQVITNPINCVGVMGAGLVLEFKNKFPDMYSDYSVRCSDKKVVIGQPYLWESNEKQTASNTKSKDESGNKSSSAKDKAAAAASL